MRTQRMITTLAVASTVILGGVLAPSPAPAPAQAIDSVWSLCAGLSPGETRDGCFADRIVGSYASEAEIRCYQKAGLAVAASIAGSLITTRDARVIAGVATVAGVFACIDTFV